MSEKIKLKQGQEPGGYKIIDIDCCDVCKHSDHGYEGEVYCSLYVQNLLSPDQLEPGEEMPTIMFSTNHFGWCKKFERRIVK